MPTPKETETHNDGLSAYPDITTSALVDELRFRGRMATKGLCPFCGQSWDASPCHIGKAHHVGGVNSAVVFVADVLAELEDAHERYPAPDGVIAALASEVGELAVAYLRAPLKTVYTEAVQVAVVALRVATEGDPTLDKLRSKRGL